MTAEDRQKWDARYASDPVWHDAREPHPWLAEHAPARDGGLALDLACGLGHDAVYLAGLGYRVAALDGSRVGLRRGLAMAHEGGLAGRVLFAQVDLDAYRPAANSADLVCVLRFLSRDLFPWLVRALRPGGTLIYATLNWRWAETHPDVNPDFLLQPGELLAAFPGLDVIAHREESDMSFLAAFKSPAR